MNIVEVEGALKDLWLENEGSFFFSCAHVCTTKSSQGHILKFLQYSVHYHGTPELSQNKEVFQTIDQFPIFETHPYASTIS